MTTTPSASLGSRSDDSESENSAPSGGQLASAARGGALNLVGSMVTAVAQFGFVLLVTRSLGAAEAGAFLIAIAVFQMIGRSAELGVSTGLIRWVANARVQRRIPEVRSVLPSALLPVFVVGFLAGVALWFGADPLAGLFDVEDAPPGLLLRQLRNLALFVPVLALFSALTNGSRGFATMRPTVFIDRLAKPLLQLAAVGLALFLGASPQGLVLAWVAPIVLLVVPAIVWFSQLLGRMELLDASLPAGGSRHVSVLRREFWSFTAPRSFASVFQIVIMWFDTILVGAMITTAAAGIYSAAIRYLMVGTFLSLAIGQAVQPLVSAAFARSDRRGAADLFQTSASWLVMVLVPMYTMVAIYAPTLLSVFGDEFVAAAPALAILSAATAVGAMAGPADTVLLMGGRSLLSSYNMAASLAANIVLNLVLVPMIGITGAGISFAVSILLGRLLPVVQVYRSLGLHPFGVATTRVLIIASSIFGGVGLLVRLALGVNVVAMLVATITSCGIYVVVLTRQRERLRLDLLQSIFRGRPAPSSRSE